MIYLTNEYPLFCPSCGKEQRDSSDFFAGAMKKYVKPLIAARSAAVEVVEMFTAKSVGVDGGPVIAGDRATIATVFDGGKCKVDLVRHVGTSKFGWLVEKVTCDDPAQPRTSKP